MALLLSEETSISGICRARARLRWVEQLCFSKAEVHDRGLAVARLSTRRLGDWGSEPSCSARRGRAK